MIVDKDHKPPLGGMGGCIYDWERGKDPWHRDAFKGVGKHIEDQIPNHGEPRAKGWHALDWCGNQIGFVADGTEIEESTS